MARFLRFPLVRIILGLILIVISTGLVQLGFVFFQRAVPSARYFLSASQLPVIIAAAAALATYYWFVRWIERRPVTELSRNGSIPELFIGAILGITLFATTVLILWICGTYRFTGFGPWQPLIRSLVVASGGAVIEEILFRGIIFRITEESLGSTIAVIISAVLFGAIHFLNPNSGILPAIAIALEAGVFLAAAYTVTRRLWFVFGAHFGWNFTEGGIFGLSVSGHQAHGGLLQGTVDGAVLLSGGSFGVEASLVAILICLSAAVLLFVYAHRRRRFIQPFWRRPSASVPITDH